MVAGTLVRAAERRREAPEAVDAAARGAREGWEADEGHEGGEGRSVEEACDGLVPVAEDAVSVVPPPLDRGIVPGHEVQQRLHLVMG